VCGAFALDLQDGIVQAARLAFGGVAATVKRAAAAEAALVGRPWTDGTLAAASAALASDFQPLSDLRASADYRMQVAQNLLKRFWLETRADSPLPADAVSVWAREPRHEPTRRSAAAGAGHAPGGHCPARTNRPRCTCSGRAPYTDDLPELAGTLHAALGLSPLAHGVLRSVDLDRLRALPGVVDVFTAGAIPGANDCGPLVHDDPILAGEAGATLRWLGQPVFAVVATTRDAARRAAARAKDVIVADPLPPVLDPLQAHAAGQYVVPPMHLSRGDARTAIDAAPQRFRTTFVVGGQEQFYLEGQVAYAVPTEAGGMKVWCSTQHPSEMQAVVAHALARPANAVHVECRRMGGGFGGKESQSALFACVAAVAAHRLQRPVKLRLDRDDDFLVTGRRHGFHFDLEIGHDDEGASWAPRSRWCPTPAIRPTCRAR
jgi:xanthine dehydrogenase molybdopterin-binding subunit B